MPRSNSVRESVHDPPPKEPSDGKRTVRYLMHIIHLLIADTLLTSVILSFLSSHKQSPLLFYLIPFIFYVTAIEICYIFRHQPPKKLSEGIFESRSLRVRSFYYQCAGAFAIGFNTSHHHWRDSVWRADKVLAVVVWALGVTLFASAIVAKEYGFEDWLEEPEPEGTIRLHEEGSVEDFSHVLPASP